MSVLAKLLKVYVPLTAMLISPLEFVLSHFGWISFSLILRSGTISRATQDILGMIWLTSVATHAAMSQKGTEDLIPLWQMCMSGDAPLRAVQWLWIYERSLRGDPSAPLLHDGQWKFNVAAPLLDSPSHTTPFVRKTNVPTKADGTPTSGKLRVATANVLTLGPYSGGVASFMGARAEDLARQFRSSQVHCIASTRNTLH